MKNVLKEVKSVLDFKNKAKMGHSYIPKMEESSSSNNNKTVARQARLYSD
jgi:hypothetical protein